MLSHLSGHGTRDVSIDELTMRVNTGASVLTLYFNKGPVMVSITGTTLFELFIINPQMSSTEAGWKSNNGSVTSHACTFNDRENGH